MIRINATVAMRLTNIDSMGKPGIAGVVGVGVVVGGSGLAIVTETESEAELLASSYAVTVIVWEPFTTDVVFQEYSHGMVRSSKTMLSSIANSI